MNSPLHASAFAHQGAGCLVLGESGSGKSRLVAEAILMGAQLIADDRVFLSVEAGVVIAEAVPQLSGVLELRGLGLIRTDCLAKHPIHLAVMLDASADSRLPELKTKDFSGISLPYLRVRPPPEISAAQILLYLKAMQEGRVLPTDWRPQA